MSPSARDVGGKGMSIRGLAGLYAVMGQNFAPGTTAADIESAMTPVGGEMFSCKIVKTTPFLLAEMVFSSKEGGERVIEMFHNKIVSDVSLLFLLPTSPVLASFSLARPRYHAYKLPLFFRPMVESSRCTLSSAVTNLQTLPRNTKPRPMPPVDPETPTQPQPGTISSTDQWAFQTR